MEGDSGMDTHSSDGLHVLADNRTGGGELEIYNGTLAFKAFNIILMTLGIVLLVITAILCTRSWQKHSRQYRRAREYETSVKASSSIIPAAMSRVRRIFNMHKSIILMRNQQSYSPQVYFIYRNLAMGDDDQENTPEDKGQPVVHEDFKSSGVILNPCMFYV